MSRRGSGSDNGSLGDGMGAARAGGEAVEALAALAAYKAVNDAESKEVARRFLSPDFIQAQVDFMAARGKAQPAAFFRAALALRPLWAMLLRDDADVLRHQTDKYRQK